jgi:hypothetical protein
MKEYETLAWFEPTAVRGKWIEDTDITTGLWMLSEQNHVLSQ